MKTNLSYNCLIINIAVNKTQHYTLFLPSPMKLMGQAPGMGSPGDGCRGLIELMCLLQKK